ncbi:MAG TPA: DUF1254 domain-containing protein [Phycisphaerae bacterium]|nr:DUF1254 domain-containing protein [Phycisphaerae bacterium]
MPSRFRLSALLFAFAIPLALAACGGESDYASDAAATPEEARAIAEEAYVYGFPLVDNYRVQYAYFGDPENPEYKGAMNDVHSTARVYTPEDKAVQTPNSDTPYSMVGMDLRPEPLVLTIPPIEKNRYYSVQLVDAYTFNFDYIGTRVTGNGGGTYMIAGPGWSGETPPGIDDVFHSETEIALAIIRTQLFGPDDLDNVKKIQAGYKAEPLSTFLGETAPAPAPIKWTVPLSPKEQRTSLGFFDRLNAALANCPVQPSEKDLRARFARIGVEAGAAFDTAALSSEMQDAIQAGMADAWASLDSLQKNAIDVGKVVSGDLFGTRKFLDNNYLYRMAGAVLGIYGNSEQEAMYPIYQVDANGDPLDGSKHAYRIHVKPGATIPVKAFWSLTMYEMPQSLLYANEIDRYLINSPMVPDLVRDPDGGVTIYIQHESPGADKEANWLPAPAGPFIAVLRLYLPGPDALDGNWKAPPLEPVTD